MRHGVFDQIEELFLELVPGSFDFHQVIFAKQKLEQNHVSFEFISGSWPAIIKRRLLMRCKAMNFVLAGNLTLKKPYDGIGS